MVCNMPFSQPALAAFLFSYPANNSGRGNLISIELVLGGVFFGQLSLMICELTDEKCLYRCGTRRELLSSDLLMSEHLPSVGPAAC